MILLLPHHSQWHNIRQLVQTKSLKLRISQLWDRTTSYRASFEHSGLLFILLLSRLLHSSAFDLDLAYPSALNPARKVSCQKLHPLYLALQETKTVFSLVWQDTTVYHPDLKTDTVPSGNILQQLPTEQSNRKWFACLFFFFYSTGYVKDKFPALAFL